MATPRLFSVPRSTALVSVVHHRLGSLFMWLLLVSPGTLADTLAWQSRFGYTGTFYDYSGIPIGGRYSLPGFPPRALLSPVITGNIARTTSDGFARFSKLALQVCLRVCGCVAISPRVALHTAAARCPRALRNDGHCDDSWSARLCLGRGCRRVRELHR